MKHYVGIDVGATRIKAGLVNANMQIVRDVVAPLEAHERSQDGLVSKLAQVIHDVCQGTHPVLVGVGVAGVIDRTRAVVARSPNFPTWKDFPLQRRLSHLSGQHVIVDNDANCVVLGEAMAGVAAGKRHLIGLTLGTGVGGGIILNGALWRGVNGMGGEIGHIVADPRGPLCGCGGTGCLEMYPSVNGLRALCRERPIVGVDAEASDLPEQLAAVARAGDSMALAHFDTVGRALGRVLGGLLNVFDIKSFLLAGGVSATWDLMETSCRDSMLAASFAEIAEGVEFLIGTLGPQAGMIGAAMQWQFQPGH